MNMTSGASAQGQIDAGQNGSTPTGAASIRTPYRPVTVARRGSPPAKPRAQRQAAAAMLRRACLIRSGQKVTVITAGDGFALHSSGSGKALGNSAANDTIRVKMDPGQQVSGTVTTTAGQVRVVL